MIMSFRGSALQTFHGKKGICILKREVSNRLIGAAQEIADITAIQLNCPFSKVAFFRSMADGFKISSYIKNLHDK